MAVDRRAGLRVVGSPAQERAERQRGGRRWDDRPGDLPTVTFTRLLQSNPTPDELTRFVAALLCWPISVEGALLAKWSEGESTMFACDALDLVRSVDGSLPSEISSIVDEAVAMGRAFQTTGADDPLLAAWRLGMPGDGVTVLVLHLAAPLDPVLVEARVGAIPELVSIYLANYQPDAVRPRRKSAPGKHVFTQRQLRILDLLASGLTYRQIGARIGFSESTVRAELLTMYRELGVHDRQEAISAARAQGLLDRKE